MLLLFRLGLGTPYFYFHYIFYSLFNILHPVFSIFFFLIFPFISFYIFSVVYNIYFSVKSLGLIFRFFVRWFCVSIRDFYRLFFLCLYMPSLCWTGVIYVALDEFKGFVSQIFEVLSFLFNPRFILILSPVIPLPFIPIFIKISLILSYFFCTVFFSVCCPSFLFFFLTLLTFAICFPLHRTANYQFHICFPISSNFLHNFRLWYIFFSFIFSLYFLLWLVSGNIRFICVVIIEVLWLYPFLFLYLYILCSFNIYLYEVICFLN